MDIDDLRAQRSNVGLVLLFGVNVALFYYIGFVTAAWLFGGLMLLGFAFFGLEVIISKLTAGRDDGAARESRSAAVGGAIVLVVIWAAWAGVTDKQLITAVTLLALVGAG